MKIEIPDDMYQSLLFANGGNKQKTKDLVLTSLRGALQSVGNIRAENIALENIKEETKHARKELKSATAEVINQKHELRRIQAEIHAYYDTKELNACNNSFDIGQYFLALRLGAKLTKKALALKIGLGEFWLYNLEKGKVTAPKEKTIGKLCGLYNLPTDLVMKQFKLVKK